MRFGKAITIVAVLIAPAMLGGCLNGIKATNFNRYEVGALTRAEPATVVSQQRVTLSSWWPFGLGLEGASRAKGEKISRKRNGFTYFVKLERTGEMLAITQADDIYVPNGGKAWVQFGERVRLLPTNNQ